MAGEDPPPREGRGSLPRLSTSHIALAGEFFVLGELALRGLDGTLTLGHTKEIDILVLNRKTEQMFRLEVKTTHKAAQHSKIFGSNYAWLMDQRHEAAPAEDLIYCFTLVGEKPERCRFFLVPSSDVAAYVKWEHPFWKAQSTRRTGRATRMRMFRVPAGEPNERELPPAWSDGRWRLFEDQWDIFDRQLHRKLGIRSQHRQRTPG